jgi:DNA-directed RNA polymerase specialized sigma24 family protein
METITLKQSFIGLEKVKKITVYGSVDKMIEKLEAKQREEENQRELDLVKRNAARDYLLDVSRAIKAAERAATEYDLALSAAAGVSGIDYTKDRVQTSPTDDAIPCAILRNEMLAQQAETLAKTAQEMQEELMEYLINIDHEEATILRLHYLIGLSTEQIALSLYISRRTVNRRIQSGLLHLYQRIIPMQYRVNYQQAI